MLVNDNSMDLFYYSKSASIGIIGVLLAQSFRDIFVYMADRNVYGLPDNIGFHAPVAAGPMETLNALHAAVEERGRRVRDIYGQYSERMHALAVRLDSNGNIINHEHLINGRLDITLLDNIITEFNDLINNPDSDLNRHLSIYREDWRRHSRILQEIRQTNPNYGSFIDNRRNEDALRRVRQYISHRLREYRRYNSRQDNGDGNN